MGDNMLLCDDSLEILAGLYSATYRKLLHQSQALPVITQQIWRQLQQLSAKLYMNQNIVWMDGWITCASP